MRGAAFYSRVIRLFDCYAAMPAAAITPHVQKSTIALTEEPPLGEREAPLGRAAPPADSQDRHASSASGLSAARRHDEAMRATTAALFAEAAKLLSRSGQWQRSLALMDGLPADMRRAVSQQAVREQWAIPADVRAAMDMLSSTPPGAGERALHGGPMKHAPATAQAAGSARPRPRRSIAAPRGVAPSSADPQKRTAVPGEVTSVRRLSGTATSSSSSLRALATSDLVNLAFSYRHASTAEVTAALRAQQHQLLDELRDRGAYRELLQCVVNWQRRGLVSDPFYASTTTTAARTLHDAPSTGASSAVKAEPTAGAALSRTEADGTRVARGPGSHSATEPSTFDAVGFVRALLFPVVEAGVVSPREPAPWRVALDAFPLLFARCVRDARPCEDFVRANSMADVYSTVCTLLRAVAGEHHTSEEAPLDRLPQRPTLAENTEVLWRAVAGLVRAARPRLRGEPKARKESLLLLAAEAMESTPQPAAAPVRVAAGTALGVGTPPVGTRASDADKTSASVRSVVETLCSSLLYREAQARFIGLALFARLGRALQATQPARGLPNALVMCLFLCIGSGQAVLPGADRRGGSSVGGTTLEAFLRAAPTRRWEHCLALTGLAQREGWFRVTSAHLHSLLSGLQSISVVETWVDALRCVDHWRTAYGVVPDDRTVPTVLLNLSQDSWRRAFTVLSYYKHGGRAVRRPPAGVTRDLHLLTVKYGAWQATLSFMAELQSWGARRAKAGTGERGDTPYIGFMNYLYCVHAAAVSGQLTVCLAMFAGLASAEGLRGDTEPFNEVTVAIAAVGMLEGQHWRPAVAFAEAVRAEHFAERRTPRSGAMGRPRLTAEGDDMACAMHLLALIGRFDAARAGSADSASTRQKLLSFLCALGAAPEASDDRDAGGRELCKLRRVLRCAVCLRSLQGLGHLHAPIRLVYDTVGGAGSYDGITAATGERNLETRQPGGRGSARSRSPLYIPPSHRQTQTSALAFSLGAALRECDSSPPSVAADEDVLTSVVRAVAETMADANAAQPFLEANLL